MIRRGWLLKVKNDGKLLTGRISTGYKNENDGIEIIQPMGICAHPKPSDKTELITMDMNGDTSRRVIMSIFGDRAQHPKPDENEVFFYAPGEEGGKQHLRLKRKRDEKKDGDGQQSRVDGEEKDSSGNKDSGRPAGMHWDMLKEKVSGTTEATNQFNADEGQGFSTKQGSVEIKAGKNTQFKAEKHLRKGEHHVDGTSYVNGDVHANDHFAGGGTQVTEGTARAQAGSEERPDGSKPWQANGRKGQVSLLQTASLVGLLQGMLNSFMQSQGQQNQQQQQQNEEQQQTNQEQQQTNQQTGDQIQQLLARIAELEQRVQQLGG